SYPVLHPLITAVPDLAAVHAQSSMITLAQIDESIGYLQQSQRIGGDKTLLAALANHQRTAHARAVQGARLVLMHHGQGVGPVQLSQGRPQGTEQIPPLPVMVRQQMGHHLGVGIRGELVIQLHESAPQRSVVFDDAVVHQRQPLGYVRMGIVLARPAVGYPACVGNSRMSMNGGSLKHPLQLGHPACGPDPRYPVTTGQNSHPRRVISTVLKSAKPLDQNRGDVASGNRAYDSAHTDNSWVTAISHKHATAPELTLNLRNMPQSLLAPIF